MKKRTFNKLIAKLARMKWRPVFHRTLDNPSAPGGRVDMWLIVDDDTGDGIVSVGCPPDRPDIPAYIADCCMNPWMTVPDDGGASMADLAVILNEGIKQHFGEGCGDDFAVDAHEVALACMTILVGYLTGVPDRARLDLVNSISARLQPLREGRLG
ncbi:hypothetical protein [Bradyrhizobium sp. 174]|uniref:hypothetical protein n=1 Tax=Bradyrhizobium sp. 174 TaxID=2782645 RepID=UPI001FF924B1|nr:hypothetical protein [Bradyrhizobium sp. 174]MCK1577884.1 hypothetical protein [Bradyrhizobium sp. 174]